ncbi:MAG: polyhydroxyalkanoate synthesis regulator DNA-binding domain-containing protein [Anaeromyxobacteraceae bacterium]
MLVKKYGNRRLYDTEQSRYITLAELADLIRQGDGDDVRVVSAKDGEDLTTATLAQIIVESRGAARLLPIPILVKLIRMGDKALAEFLGPYLTWALEVYVQATKGVQTMVPWGPFLATRGSLARLLGLRAARSGSSPPPPAAPAPGASSEEIAALRREIEELRHAVKRRRR